MKEIFCDKICNFSSLPNHWILKDVKHLVCWQIIFLQAALTNETIPKKEKIRLEELISLVATDISPVPSVPNNDAAPQSKNLLSPSNSNGSISPVTLAKRQINIISKAGRSLKS